MLLLLSAVKLVCEIALMSMLGQWVLGLLAGAKRDQNIFYQVLAQIGRPFVLLARLLSPRSIVLDRHVPLVAFLVLAFAWIVVTALRIQHCLQIGVELCKMNKTLNHRFARWQVKLMLMFNRRQAAIERVDAMLAADPQDVYALATRAHLLAERGDKAGAVDALERLVAARPQQASGWFNLGFLREELGRLDEAEQAFRQSIALDEKFDRAWYGLALCLIRQRRFDDAVVALKRNTQLQPMSPFGWYQLARVHVDRQEPEEAAKIIRHLRKFEPKVAAQLERETGLVQQQPV